MMMVNHSNDSRCQKLWFAFYFSFLNALSLILKISLAFY